MAATAAALSVTSLRFTITVKSGPHKGGSYQLIPPRVTIGRGPENNIELKDPKVSRHQAVIEFHSDRVVVRDLSSRKNLSVNGTVVQDARLSNGDIIGIGDTELAVKIEPIAVPRPTMPMPPGQPPQRLPSASHGPTGLAPHGRPQAPGRLGPTPQTRHRPRTSSSHTDDGAKKMRFYIIVLIVGAGLAWLLMSEKPAAPPKKGLRTTEEIEAEIRGSEERQELLLKERDKDHRFDNDVDRMRFDEADIHFRQGFRDYQRGNYSRAMRSFETARAIDPNHDRAKRYYQLAVRKRDEFVDRFIREGRKYKEKNMFTRCVSSLDAALKALGDLASDQDVKVKEARALKRECEFLLKERF